jgi:phosphoesterase RecJ-like protein
VELPNRWQAIQQGLEMDAALRLNKLDVSSLVKKIRDARSIILTTHRQCDGDGLGATLGLYHGLRKLNKEVRLLFVDGVPAKYDFLNPKNHIEVFEGVHRPVQRTDLALIFDTNDRRLISPLYEELERHCREILFVDHHPILNIGPEPTTGSFIETRAASTGEIAYFIIRELGIRLDATIAQALYTSIAFDTQIFRYIKSAPNSHIICAELIEHVKNPEGIHRALFSTYTVGKIQFLSKVLGEVEYFNQQRIAVLRLRSEDMLKHGMALDDARDLIDILMNITSVQAAAVFRQDAPQLFKLSLRSKGQIEVLGVAESFQGGGHMYASGAYVHGDYEVHRDAIVDQLHKRMDAVAAGEG